MKHTAAILDFASAPHTLPLAVSEDALRLLADTLAVMAAGAASEEALNLRRAVVEPAFFNGFAIHCLEWDAVHEPAVVHAMSVVTAALLASASRLGGVKPDDFLLALALGVDIASGLGIAATGPMQFFRPATAGVIGAALAVGRLEMIGPQQMRDALGFAYSFAGGTMQAHVEASIALPLQIGRASHAAIQAVDMAKAGMNAPRNVLEGPFGYSTLIEPLSLAKYTTDLGKTWRIGEVSIKPYPSGRASHGVLGALQVLRADLQLENIVQITLFAPPLIQRLVGRLMSKDMHTSHARLCLPFLVALLLTDGVIDPRRFNSATFADAGLLSFAEKITVIPDDNRDANAMSPQRLVVQLNDGSMIERTINANPGSPGAPMTAAQLASKYALCRELAPHADPRIFDDPLTFATEPA